MQTSNDYLIEAYIDGACEPNPGRGGWAAVILDKRGDYPIVIELAGRVEGTTNNRMELTAAVQVLHYAPAVPTRIYSDSSYLVDGASSWMKNWKRKGWKNLKNVDIWKDIDVLGAGAKWVRIRGHSGIPGNERADFLATEQIRNGPPPGLFRCDLRVYPVAAFKEEPKAEKEWRQRRSRSRKYEAGWRDAIAAAADCIVGDGNPEVARQRILNLTNER